MTAFWVSFKYSPTTEECEDRERISLLMWFEPVATRFWVMRYTELWWFYKIFLNLNSELILKQCVPHLCKVMSRGYVYNHIVWNTVGFDSCGPRSHPARGSVHLQWHVKILFNDWYQIPFNSYCKNQGILIFKHIKQYYIPKNNNPF